MTCAGIDSNVSSTCAWARTLPPRRGEIEMTSVGLLLYRKRPDQRQQACRAVRI